jgi:hypothetical protein
VYVRKGPLLALGKRQIVSLAAICLMIYNGFILGRRFCDIYGNVRVTASGEWAIARQFI